MKILEERVWWGFNCSNCASPLEVEPIDVRCGRLDEQKNSLESMQYRRGFSDARAGHTPALLGGPYLRGYREGRRGDVDGRGKIIIFYVECIKCGQRAFVPNKKLTDTIKIRLDGEAEKSDSSAS